MFRKVSCRHRGWTAYIQRLNKNDNRKLKEVYNLSYQRWRRKAMREEEKGGDIKCG